MDRMSLSVMKGKGGRGTMLGIGQIRIHGYRYRLARKGCTVRKTSNVAIFVE
jgi:hypothetical protein